jgi:YHS domain-containing protein
MASDPVCGREINEDQARQSSGMTTHGANEVDPTQGTRSFHEGKWYYFCSLECRSAFIANPASYLKS